MYRFTLYFKSLSNKNRGGTYKLRLHEAGLILFTSKYEEMVRFYRDQLCLPVRADKQFFIVFQWGYGYLMLEPHVEGHRVQPPHIGVSPHVLRLNVFDIE